MNGCEEFIMYENIQSLDPSSQNLPLYVLSVAIDHSPQKYVSPGGHDNYICVCCRSGTGELTTGSEKCMMKKNDACFICPGTAYGFNARSADWKLDIIEFDGTAASQILSALGITDNSTFHFFDPSVFHRKLLKIRKIFHTLPEHADEESSSTLYSLLISLRACSRPSMLERISPVHGGQSRFALRIIEYLENHYNEAVDLDAVAAHVGLTKRYMCTVFKREMNTTIITELTNIRMGHARMFLKQYPEKSVKEIAGMCGYENAGYFGKVFYRITGRTPDQYRRKNIK